MNKKIFEFLKKLNFSEKKAVFNYLEKYFENHEVFIKNDEIKIPEDKQLFMLESIEILNLSNRVANKLLKQNIRTIGQLVAENKRDFNLRFRLIGEMGIEEITIALNRYGLSLNEDELSIPSDYDKFMEQSIDVLRLETRANLGLVNNQVRTIRQLMAVTKWELRFKFNNVGKKTVEEISAALAKCGLFLKEK